ncbi:transposase [Staphylococcus aureus]|nr:transposase [Staphylococcus aureus]
MMLKIILYAYTQSVFSGRRIEKLLHDSIRMMWLAQDQTPSYKTINRFRVNPNTDALIESLFIQFHSQCLKQNLIDNNSIFIDGTKVEANANRYTFVWKKSIQNHESKLNENSKALYRDLVEEKIIPEIKEDGDSDLTIEEIVLKLENRPVKKELRLRSSKRNLMIIPKEKINMKNKNRFLKIEIVFLKLIMMQLL